MATVEQLQQFLERLPAKIQEAAEVTLQQSALKINADLMKVFKTEGQSHGVNWAPLKQRYREEKIKKGFSEKILQRTTTLRQSFTARFAPMEAVIGTEVKYAIFHETGTRKMPARPFAKPVSETFQEEKIGTKIFVKVFDEVLKSV